MTGAQAANTAIATPALRRDDREKRKHFNNLMAHAHLTVAPAQQRLRRRNTISI
jgi:hypothetical protein